MVFTHSGVTLMLRSYPRMELWGRPPECRMVNIWVIPWSPFGILLWVHPNALKATRDYACHVRTWTSRLLVDLLPTLRVVVHIICSTSGSSQMMVNGPRLSLMPWAWHCFEVGSLGHIELASEGNYIYRDEAQTVFAVNCQYQSGKDADDAFRVRYDP